MFVAWLVWICVLIIGQCDAAEGMPAIAVHLHKPFDRTLGFPGEGPNVLTLVTANVTTAEAVREGKLDLHHADFLVFTRNQVE
jgi:hypothetical protein